MNGPPANPISGIPPSSAVSMPIAWLTNDTSPGSRSRSATTSASSLIGLSITGPTPGLISTLDADRAERHDDVAEQDRGVDPVPADRLQA